MRNVKFLCMPVEFLAIKLITTKTIIVLNKKIISKSGKQNDLIQKNLLNDISNIDMFDLKGFSIGILFSKGGDEKNVIK